MPYTNTLEASATVVFTPTSSPHATDTPIKLVASVPTSVPDDVDSVEPLRLALRDVIDSGQWDGLGLPTDVAEDWESFAEGKVELPAHGIELLDVFLNQWDLLNRLLLESKLPKNNISFKARLTQTTDENILAAPYLVEENSEQLRYFLIARDHEENPVALLPAPEITGLTQQISADGNYVEYSDARDQRKLIADARKLDVAKRQENALKERLAQIYPDNRYQSESTYPRYRLPVEGLEANFYGLEQSLSYSQIILLNEAFELFDRPTFQILKKEIFGATVSVLPVDSIGKAAGLTYTGTGVIELDRRDLFGNRYYLASVLAHEGSHVLQGAMPSGGDKCAEILRREVGNQTIPPGFYGWSAEELVWELREGQIGAYHVSLWMLSKLGFNELQGMQNIIYTGKVNGQSVVIACDNN